MPRIAFVQDPRLSRDRNLAIVQGLAPLRTSAEIDVLKGDTTEKDLLERSRSSPYDLYVVPWHMASGLLQLEAALGVSRVDGPLIVGYAGEALHEPPPSPGGVRPILINFADALGAELAVKTLKHLAHTPLRVGMGEWLDTKALTYSDVWRTPDLARSLNQWLAIPEFASPEWSTSLAAVRSVLLAAWSLVWEVGPGRTASARASAAKGEPLAQLLVGVDTRYAVVQILMKSGRWHPGDLLRLFWNPHPLSPAGVLQNYSKLCRVHAVTTQPWVEVTAIVSNVSSPEATRASVWIEPVSEQLFISQTDATERNLVPMPGPRPESQPSETSSEIVEGLRQQLAEQTALVQELRSGGVGLPADQMHQTGDLLELFQERYFDAKLALHQCRTELSSLEIADRSPGTEARIAQLQQNIAALENRLHAWVKQLGGTIEKLRKERID